MNPKKWHVYLVNLEPKVGTKPGKKRPCLCIQPEAFLAIGSSVVIPLTTKLTEPISEAYPLRIRIGKGIAGLVKDSDLLIDQILAWDHSLFHSELGVLPEALQDDVKLALKEFLEL